MGRRRKEQDAPKKVTISSSKDVYNALRPKLQDLPHEEFWVILLSRNNKILDMQLVGRGGITGTVADVRVILKLAIENSASGIIVSHNHPSGNLKPSPQDIQLTKKIKEASTIMDISLLDHLIFTDDGYLSFADEGML